MTTAAQCVHLSSHPVVSWTRLSRMHGGSGFFFGNLISSFVRWLLWSLMDISGMLFFFHLYIYFLSSPFLPFFLNEFQCNKFACVVNEDDGHWVLLFGSFIQKKTDTNFVCCCFISSHPPSSSSCSPFAPSPQPHSRQKRVQVNECWHGTKSQRKCAINFVCASSPSLNCCSQRERKKLQHK